MYIVCIDIDDDMCAQPVVFLRGQKTLTGIEPVTHNTQHGPLLTHQCTACNKLT